MSTTPGKSRLSGIPTPGKSSGIPTPGRLRSSSSAAGSNGGSAHPDSDVHFLSRTLADAIKANDPAQHRLDRPSDVSSMSLSPQSTIFASASGRRSVASRPSSVASSASAVSSTATRVSQTRTMPLPIRPPSRTSDVFTRSISRTGRPFEVGDDVRIESLGFEGVVRFLGEINGKSGMWAGVELSAGFAGLGKNNGSVNGIQYFSCPQNCGVFVALSKLSPPAVRTSMMSRPSSVASTRSGRTTPSITGRATPSVSTGRITPSVSIGHITPAMSTGRITPSLSNSRVTPSLPSGRTTPATRTKSMAYPRSTMVTPKTITMPAENKITPGSIASKYVGMKAYQLDSREPPVPAMPRKSFGMDSPTRKAYTSASTMSPTRTMGSPFNTPKAGLSGQQGDVMSSPTKGRISLKTPRPRIPSAVAMPPPPSPSMALSSLAISLNDDFSDPKPRRTSRSLGGTGSPRPDSATSSRSTPVREMVDEMSRLQSRLDALDFENQQLRESQQESLHDQADDSTDLAVLRTERDELQSRIGTLEMSLKTQERCIHERDTRIQSLERSMKDTALDISKLKSDSENRIREIQAKLDDTEALNRNLKEVLEAKEGQENASDAVLVAKSAEISVLEGRIEKVYKELEEERKDLGSQVDELRAAGQETIALYEERLSASETKRYEMEDLIISLEDQLRSTARPPSPSSLAIYASSAAQIDNETLKDQVQHLQKKIASLEDMLEDARAVSEREETTARERLKRYKDKEEWLKKEVIESKKEIERLSRSEENAKQRLSESEEAFRENAVTLENARAEIEVLRSELANMEDLSSELTSTELPRKASDLALRATSERGKLLDELKTRLGETVTEKGSLSQALESVKLEMERLTETHQFELIEERRKAETLRQELEERVVELESLRKKVNREVTIDSTIHHSTPSKHDAAASREEITGLKHIIQELQKEISELESLIESKIYREDDLEREVERLKEKLSRTQKKTTRYGIESPTTKGTALSTSSAEEVCEICEKPGHDIFSCSLLKDEPAVSTFKHDEELICEDCEGRGHLASACPYATEVF